jgi:hypothetical protein
LKEQLGRMRANVLGLVANAYKPDGGSYYGKAYGYVDAEEPSRVTNSVS